MTATILDAPLGSDARAAFDALGPAREVDHGPHAAGQRCLVAVDDGVPVARVVARFVPGLAGCLGWFEARDESAPTDALFEAAVDWLHAQGTDPIVGPMRGDTWHRYRLNVGPFDQRPFPMEPMNPPFYAGLWTRAGFTELERYVSVRVDDVEAAAARLRPRLDAARDAGYVFRPFDRDRPDDELALLYRLSCEGFRDNFLYTEITREAFDALYRPALPVVQPQVVWFAHGPDGEPAGFIFSLMDPGDGASTVNLKSTAVVPAHRGRGLGSALGALAYDGGTALGAVRANLCLLREGNPSQRLDGGAGRVFRNYVLYAHEYEPGTTA